MSALTRSDMEECGSIEALRSLFERRQREAFDEAGAGVFTSVLRQNFDPMTGGWTFEAIPINQFFEAPR